MYSRLCVLGIVACHSTALGRRQIESSQDAAAAQGPVAGNPIMVSADLIARYELLRSQLDDRFRLLKPSGEQTDELFGHR